MTEDQIEKLRNERVALAYMRAQERRQRPLWARLRDAVDQAKVFSTAKASNLDPVDISRQKAGSREPPQAQDTDWSGYLARVELALEHFEEALDAERGLSPARDFKRMTTSELDRELAKWAGVDSHEVARRAPWLGKTYWTICRARKRMGVRQNDGLPIEDNKAA